jgi:ketosteroid isomerase-like protein
MTTRTRTPADTVRRYYALVADLTSAEDELAALLHTDAILVEHPNLLLPHGAVRDRAGTLAGLRAGRQLLSRQAFTVLQIVGDGTDLAVRARWTGEIGRDLGGFRAGQTLEAEIAAFVTLDDGRVRRHETFDCYRPFSRDAPADTLDR